MGEWRDRARNWAKGGLWLYFFSLILLGGEANLFADRAL